MLPSNAYPRQSSACLSFAEVLQRLAAGGEIMLMLASPCVRSWLGKCRRTRQCTMQAFAVQSTFRHAYGPCVFAGPWRPAAQPGLTCRQQCFNMQQKAARGCKDWPAETCQLRSACHCTAGGELQSSRGRCLRKVCMVRRGPRCSLPNERGIGRLQVLA